MALRAGYYGLKRSLKDKLFNLAASTPADIGPDNPIAGKNDVLSSIDLLDDTVGWIGGNLNGCKYVNISEANYAFTDNNDGTVTGEIKNVSASTQTSNCSSFTAPFSAQVMLSGGVSSVATIYPWDVTTDTRPYTDSTKTTQQTADDIGSGVSFWMEEGHQYKLRPRFMANAAVQTVVFKPMLLTIKQYALNPVFRPHHESVEEMLTTKDVAVTAGTDVTVNTNTHVYNKAGIVSGSMRLEIGATLTAGATIATLSVKPKGTTYAIAIDNTDASVIPIIIGTNGAVQLFASFVPTEGHQLLIPVSFIDDPGTVSNREISADIEPEYKYQAKKATKKKVIKEEE